MVAAGFSAGFNALFDVSGNSAEKLRVIEQAGAKLATTAANLTGQLFNVGKELNFIGRTGGGPQLAEVGQNLIRMSESGQVTSNRLIQLTKELETLALTLNASTVPSITAASKEIQVMGAQIRLVEQEANKAGTRGFVFMGDATDRMAQSVRNAGSAMQGLLLGTSILEGNIQGLAFSLIFLQFSGVLRLSLAIATLTVVGGGLVKVIKSIVANRKEMTDLANSFFIITRNTQAFQLATEQADNITKDLGLSIKDEKELNKSLLISMDELRKRGIEPTADNLRLFTDAWLANRAAGEDYETSMQNALETTLSLKNGQAKLFDSVRDVSEINKIGEASLQRLTDLTSRDAVVAVSDLVTAYEKAGKEIPDSIQAWVDSNETGVISVRALIAVGQADILKFLDDNAINLETVSKRLDDAFSGFSKSAEDNVGTEGIANRAIKDFEQTIFDLNATGDLTPAVLEAFKDEAILLGSTFPQSFIDRLNATITAWERLLELGEDIKRLGGTPGVERGEGEGDIFPPPGVPGGPPIAVPVPIPPGGSLVPPFILPPEFPGSTPPSITLNFSGNTVRSDDDLVRLSGDMISVLRRVTKPGFIAPA